MAASHAGTGPMLLSLLLFLMHTGTFVGAVDAAPTSSIAARLGCVGADHVTDKCLTEKLQTVLELGRMYLVTVARLQYGAVGPEHNITGVRFNAGSKATLGVSGTGISVRGLDSIHVKRARSRRNTVEMTLVVPNLDIKGEIDIKFPPISHTFGIDIRIVNLTLDATVTAAPGRAAQLVVGNVAVKIAVQKMKVAVTNNKLLDSLVSHWVNDNKVLNTKTLPWLAKILGRRLKKILQKYVTKIK